MVRSVTCFNSSRRRVLFLKGGLDTILWTSCHRSSARLSSAAFGLVANIAAGGLHYPEFNRRDLFLAQRLSKSSIQARQAKEGWRRSAPSHEVTRPVNHNDFTS